MLDEKPNGASNMPLKLFLLGYVLIFVGVVVVVAASLIEGNSDVNIGGIVFVGPIPVIFGAGPYSFVAILLAAVLTIIGFAMFVWMRRQESRS